MKNIVLTTTAIVTLSATSAIANEINFNQRDSVGVSNLAFEQASSGSGGNTIDLGLSGGMTSVVIKQSGGELGNTSSGNIANVELYMNSDVTQFDSSDDAERVDGWKTFSAVFDDNSQFDFNLGTAVDATQFGDVDVAIAVTGDGNNLTHNVTNGLSGDKLQIGGTVNGDNNSVHATLGAAGDIAFNYDIQGDNNVYESAIDGPASGGRTLDIAIEGNSNKWTVFAAASGGVVNVASIGSNINGTHWQSGQGSVLQMVINKSGSAAFRVETIQNGPAYANVPLNATDGGSFKMAQTGTASYIGAINLSAGGTVTITQ